MGRPWGIVTVESLEEASERYLDVIMRAGCPEVVVPLDDQKSVAVFERDAHGTVTVVQRDLDPDVQAAIGKLRHTDMTWNHVDRFFDSVMMFLPVRDLPSLRLGDPDKTIVGGCDLLLFHDGEFGTQFHDAGETALRHKLIVRIWP